jgi:acetyltransferase
MCRLPTSMHWTGVLAAVSQLLADLPHLAELDINPLLVDASGAIALDARIRLSAQPVPGPSALQ